MAKATWRIVALSALLGAVAPLASVMPAQAQVVIGGSGQPDVVVNWGVLDSLGRQPSLADMLKDDMRGHDGAASLTPPGVKRSQPSAAPQGLTYKPYKPGKAKDVAVKPTKAKPTKVAASKPAAVKPQPPRDEPADIAAIVEQRKAAEPVKTETPAKVAAKPAVPAKAPVAEAVPAAKAPEVALPEVKKAEPAPAKPVEVAKAPEPAKPQPAKVPEPVKIAEPVKAPEPVKAAEPAKAPEAAPVETAKAAEPPKPQPAPAPAAIAAAPQPMLAPVPPPIPVMPQQVASLPSSEPAAISRGSDALSLLFAAEDSKLSDSGRAELASLIKRMQKDEDLNLQLLAYASGDEASSSKARRLSLSRALEVRKVLMDKGIRSTRIEVRALGNKLDGRGPADRVDAVLVGR
ncbi:MAG: OmpA family protein [Magnetospirillum sp.]|nr:OmpA family protein [Magnetospirillum sp.]